jgi:hypothetical protein
MAAGTKKAIELINEIMDGRGISASAGEVETILLREINDAIMQWYEKSGGNEDPAYRMTIILPKAESVSVNQNLNNGCSYDKETRILTIPATGTGVTWREGTGFTNNYINQTGQIIEYKDWVDPGIGQEVIGSGSAPTIHSIKVEELISSTKVKLAENDITATLSGSKIGVELGISSQTDNIDISGYTEYKTIYTIIKITDSATAAVVQKEENDFENIKAIKIYVNNYRDMIIWTRSGGMIKMWKGNLDSYGLRKMIYIRIPILCTTPEDYLDIRDANLNTIKAMLSGKTIETNQQQ